MNNKQIIFSIYYLLISSFILGQEKMKEIYVNTDSVRWNAIKELIDNDSVSTLEYEKIIHLGMPDIIDERVVYLDYRKTIITIEIEKAKKQVPIINELSSDSIKNAYVPIYKLNNSYVVFRPDFEHPRIITDSTINYKDDEGLISYPIQEISFSENYYKLIAYDYQKKEFTKKIRLYDSDRKIQLWKETHFVGDSKKYVNYSLYIPINEASNYPILNIINSAGQDDYYEKFDNLELENKF